MDKQSLRCRGTGFVVRFSTVNNCAATVLKLHECRLYAVCWSLWWGVRLVVRVARMEEKINTYRVLVEKPEVKRPLGRTKVR
jgi:hypothetical protein